MPELDSSQVPFDLEGALDEIEQSGCRVAAFARERGLPRWRLYEGLRRRRRRAGMKCEPAEPELVPVRLDEAARAVYDSWFETLRVALRPGPIDRRTYDILEEASR
jgi:hypothetical protein